MKKVFLVATIGLIIILSGCAKSTESWAYQFVKYNGNTYILTEIRVSDVVKTVGSVKYYSTDETSSTSDYFSNYYKEGTELYSIKNTDVNDAIAVKESDNKYVKLVNKNEMRSSK